MRVRSSLIADELSDLMIVLLLGKKSADRDAAPCAKSWSNATIVWPKIGVCPKSSGIL